MNYYESIAKQACNNLSNFDLVNKLKINAEGELATIILYQEHLASVTDKRVRDVLTEILSDEIDHLVKLKGLLAMLGNG